MKITDSVISKIKSLLQKEPDIRLCIVFGSIAAQQENFNSDLDIAVAGQEALNATRKMELVERFAIAFGRPVDLIDLHVTSGTLLHQILTKGTLVYCNNDALYAHIIKKMLFNQTDMMPYHHRILKERRERWING